MTASDRPVQDLIETTLHKSLNIVGPMRHIFGDEAGDAVEVLLAQEVEHASAAVVAACREATVAQQAQLVGGLTQATEVQRLGPAGRFRWVKCSRVVTEWREDPS